MKNSATSGTSRDESSRGQITDDFSLAYALLRITLGVNIAMHGISRILVGLGVFTAAIEKQFAVTPLPQFAVRAFGNTLPWAEALIGLLVLVGAATRIALVTGGLVIIILTFGSTLHQDWDIAGLQLIYPIAYAVLVAFLKHNSISLDRLFGAAQERLN